MYKNDSIVHYHSMLKALRRYVDINPKILGGTPVIAGTRIPVVRVVSLIKQGYNPSDLQKDYPWVNPKKIQYVIAYLMKAGLNEFEKAHKESASSR